MPRQILAMKRLNELDEIAQMILYPCSDAAIAITCVDCRIDGGFAAR